MLINKKAVKQYALDCAARRFPPNERWATREGQRVRVNEPKMIRVSPDFLAYMEGVTKNAVNNYVNTMSSEGRTIK